MIVAIAALSIAASGDTTLPGDVAIARFIQDAPDPPADWVAAFGNWIGSSRVFVVIGLATSAALVIWRKWTEAGVLILATFARVLNGAMKELFDSPRPTPEQVRVIEFPESLGFPSGHSMGSMLGFGAIAIVASRLIPNRRGAWAARIACGGIIVIVGFGRIYTGAHWPSDVLGGFLWGSLLLIVVVYVVERWWGPVLRRRRGS